MGRPGPKPSLRRVDGMGYISLYMPDHPGAWKSGRIAEHRVVMERHLGRRLKRSEHVHHKDGNRQNNAIENLEILTSSEHTRIHKREISAVLRNLPILQFQEEYAELGGRKMSEKYGLSGNCAVRIAHERNIQVCPRGMSMQAWKTIQAFRKIDTETLRSLYQKHGVLEIGKQHGVSAPVVTKLLLDRGIPLRKKGVSIRRPRKTTKIANLGRQALLELYDQHTMPELADMFHVALSTVLLAMKRHGIETRPRGPRQSESASHGHPVP